MVIPWFDILQSAVSILALAVLYDVAYRLSQTYPYRVRYEVGVGLVFSGMMMFMQLTPFHIIQNHQPVPIHVGFELLMFAALMGGWMSGGICLAILVGVQILIIRHPYTLTTTSLGVLLTLFGYALRVGYKSDITTYTIREWVAVALVVICLLLLLPLAIDGTNPLLQSADIFSEWLAVVFITVLLTGLVLRRVAMVHQTEARQRQRAEYEGFLTHVISDEVMKIIMDADGNIIAIHDMLALDDAQRITSVPDNWIDCIHPNDIPVAQTILTDLRSGKSTTTELRMRRGADPTYLWRRIYTVPITDKITRRVERAYVAIKNIDAEKRIQWERQNAEIERQRVEILKAFSIQAEHQFRTPLTSIHTNVYLLRHVTDDQKRARYLDNIETQANLLLELVESLTLLTQIEIREELTIHQIQLNDIVQGLLHTFIPKAQAQNIQITATLDNSLPTLYANYQFVKSSVMHLLRNAVMYTPAGGTIDIQTCVTYDDKGRKGVQLTVSDTGIGMSEAVRARAFERFFRADNVQTMPGLGLGLPLVKEVAKHYSGSVTLTSQVGEGTTVQLFLPVTV